VAKSEAERELETKVVRFPKAEGARVADSSSTNAVSFHPHAQ
jgi:hypothetical protein